MIPADERAESRPRRGSNRCGIGTDPMSVWTTGAERIGTGGRSAFETTSATSTSGSGSSSPLFLGGTELS